MALNQFLPPFPTPPGSTPQGSIHLFAEHHKADINPLLIHILNDFVLNHSPPDLQSNPNIDLSAFSLTDPFTEWANSPEWKGKQSATYPPEKQLALSLSGVLLRPIYIVTQSDYLTIEEVARAIRVLQIHQLKKKKQEILLKQDAELASKVRQKVKQDAASNGEEPPSPHEYMVIYHNYMLPPLEGHNSPTLSHASVDSAVTSITTESTTSAFPFVHKEFATLIDEKHPVIQIYIHLNVSELLPQFVGGVHTGYQLGLKRLYLPTDTCHYSYDRQIWGKRYATVRTNGCKLQMKTLTLSRRDG